MTTAHNEMGRCVALRETQSCGKNVCPPALFEYVWYVILVYGTLGQAWGIVVPLVNGALLMLLAAACLLLIGTEAPRVYAPMALALCTGMSVIAIQFFFHSELALSSSFPFVGWLCMVIVAQSLILRPGFLNRFALVAFGIGLACLPFIEMGGSGVIRARATGTGISNGNVLAMWFGFCTVYFVFWGLQCRDVVLRVVSWVAALSSLFVVALTVSRGPLLAMALAFAFGLRSVLRRHFTPVLSLIFLMFLVYVSGVFEQTIDYYTARGAEESGRGHVWPLVIERIGNSPWTGVGMDNMETLVGERTMTPHNALLYIGLAAGIIPVMCFLGYLARAVTGAFYIMKRSHAEEATVLPPLVIFALVEIMMADAYFMFAWQMVVFGLAASARQLMTDSQ
jgi:O-antigen ligase